MGIWRGSKNKKNTGGRRRRRGGRSERGQRVDCVGVVNSRGGGRRGWLPSESHCGWRGAMEEENEEVEEEEKEDGK